MESEHTQLSAEISQRIRFMPSRLTYDTLRSPTTISKSRIYLSIGG